MINLSNLFPSRSKLAHLDRPRRKKKLTKRERDRYNYLTYEELGHLGRAVFRMLYATCMERYREHPRQPTHIARLPDASLLCVPFCRDFHYETIWHTPSMSSKILRRDCSFCQIPAHWLEPKDREQGRRDREEEDGYWQARYQFG
jgi:hypothetical protein